MGRPRRDFAAGGTFHVAAHASDDRRLFVTDADRVVFRERLATTLWKCGVELISYVLMGTHYHALVWTPDARLSPALQGVHGGYSLLHNLAHGRAAHLFRAHCLARRIEDDDDFLTAIRYLALNPVAAGLVVDPLDWPWSSCRVHAGRERPRLRLAEDRLRAAFGDRESWRARYREFVAGLS